MITENPLRTRSTPLVDLKKCPRYQNRLGQWKFQLANIYHTPEVAHTMPAVFTLRTVLQRGIFGRSAYLICGWNTMWAIHPADELTKHP